MLPLADLQADCSRCAALCCVAPAFSRSADFALDKPAGARCPHLRADDRCGIHDRLLEEGFRGCAAYDCFGAGQRLTRTRMGGHEVTAPMLRALPVMRGLHELLWYLGEALARPQADHLRPRLRELAEEVDGVAAGAPDALLAVDLDGLRARVAPLLREVSARVRRGYDAADHSAADLSGVDLRRADLSGASLRGALLLGADLRGATLRDSDLLGADLRGADVRGAALAGALFLTRTQLHGTRGDAATTVPAVLLRPPHWG